MLIKPSPFPDFQQPGCAVISYPAGAPGRNQRRLGSCDSKDSKLSTALNGLASGSNCRCRLWYVGRTTVQFLVQQILFMNIWIIILGMVLVAHLLKLLPLALLGEITLPIWAERGLNYVPIAILSAIIGVSFVPSPDWFSFTTDRLASWPFSSPGLLETFP
jgi:hypothetical protein